MMILALETTAKAASCAVLQLSLIHIYGYVFRSQSGRERLRTPETMPIAA